MQKSLLNLLTCFLAALCLILSTPADTAAQESTQPEATPARVVSQTGSATILSVLRSQGNFTKLVSALEKTGMNKTLEGKGNYTLFAPTDKAFEKLPAGTLDDMPKEELAKLLKHHIVVDKVNAERAQSLGKVMTATGETLSIQKAENTFRINEANVVKADIMAENGVIHSIDSVLK